MLPRVLTVAPSTAISWMSYEFFSESQLVRLVGILDTLLINARFCVGGCRGTHTAKWYITRDGSACLKGCSKRKGRGRIWR